MSIEVNSKDESWFEDPPEGRAQRQRAIRLIAICALAGGVAGLIIGLLFPNLAASFQSALVGALLMVYSGLQLLTVHAPDMAAKVAMTTRLHLILLGLITIVGVAIQWTLFQRKADR